MSILVNRGCTEAVSAQPTSGQIGSRSATCIGPLTRPAWSWTCSFASADAFFRHAIERIVRVPHGVITNRHDPYVKAVATTCPGARHRRDGLPRARGDTTKIVERSHAPT